MRAEEFIQLDEAGLKTTLAALAATGGLALGNSPDKAQNTPDPIQYDQTVTQADKANSIDPHEQLVLAQTMWGEARNHGIEGMRAVGHVIMNRLNSNQANFGDSVSGVAQKRKQFSAWNKGDPNREKMLNIVDDYDNLEYDEFSKAYDLAGKIISGKDADNTNGAIMYHTSNITPYWAANIEPTGKIANHVFYDEFPRA